MALWDGLQIKTDTTIISGGYPGEIHGSTGDVPNWTSVDSATGSKTATYYYHDSWPADNNNSSRVEVDVTDSWEILSVDDRNFMTIQVTTSVTRIARRLYAGNPGSGLIHLWVKDKENGTTFFETANSDVQATETLSNGFVIGTHTYVLEPAQTVGRGSVWYRSTWVGYESLPIPNTYTDVFWMGVNFRNILPRDYRPGKVLIPDGTWQSHNRENGATNILNNSGSWQTMRTQDGALSTGNPPVIRHTNGTWYNMRRIGENDRPY